MLKRIIACLSATLLLASLGLIPGCTSPKQTSPHTTTPTAYNPNPLRNIRFWAYQINNEDQPGTIQAYVDSRYDMLVLDDTRSVKGNEAYDVKTDVARLKASLNSFGGKKIVIAYMDAGEAEDYRWYWQEGWQIGRPDWIVAKDPGGWKGNYPVKFWKNEWKELMKQYLDKIIEDGYDGVYLDWLEAYSFGPVKAVAKAEGLDPEKEMKRFILDLRSHVEKTKPEFIFIAQNAAELGKYPEYVYLFDAISQEEVFSGKETKTLIDQLKLWQDLQKPVFNVEYETDPAKAKRLYEIGDMHKYKTYVTTRELDRPTITLPPGY